MGIITYTVYYHCKTLGSTRVLDVETYVRLKTNRDESFHKGNINY
jgi:hypothetical protein